MNFRRSVIFTELWRPEVAKRAKNFHKCLRFGDKRPLMVKCQNSLPKVFIATPIDVMCKNFVKFVRREIGEIVRCLPDKNFAYGRYGSPVVAIARGSRPK